MARGRFISKEICVDKKVNSLSTPWSMLAYTWLITHADCEGRTYGDPSIIKSMVFPRQDGKITTQQVEEFIQEWVEVGLVNLYEADGDVYLEFPSFEKHQIGLRKDREPSSIIPANIRQTSGSLPAEVKLREVEVKLSKVEGDTPQISPVQRMLEKVTGIMPSNANDMKALDEIEAMHPTQDDVQAGADWYKGQGKVVRYYSSLVGPIRTAIATRVQDKHTVPRGNSTQAIQDRNKQVIDEILREANNGNT